MTNQSTASHTDRTPRIPLAPTIARRLLRAAKAAGVIVLLLVPLWSPLIASAVRPDPQDFGLDINVLSEVPAFQAVVEKTLRATGQLVPTSQVVLSAREPGRFAVLSEAGTAVETDQPVVEFVPDQGDPYDLLAPSNGNVSFVWAPAGRADQAEPLVLIESGSVSFAAAISPTDAAAIASLTARAVTVDVFAGAAGRTCTDFRVRRTSPGDLQRQPSASSTYAYEVACRLEDANAVLPGLPATLTATYSTERAVTVVPRTAVTGTHGSAFVDRVAQDGRVERVPVDVGLFGDLYVEIISGLEVGDRVLDGTARTAGGTR